MNILYLDNDECLGYFSLISGLYTETVCDYCLKLKLLEKNLDRINAEALFILFASELLDMGFARPGLKEFFYKLKKLKNKKSLDKIIMYTSAERYSQTEKNYVNWVGFMKNLFEFYSTKKHDDTKDLFLIYDLDHSGRSDEIPRESPDGATLKSVEVPLKRLGISMDDVKKIVFLDDRPQNIFIDGNEQQNKLKRIGVLPYYYLPKKEILKELCLKYDDDFMKLGMKSLSSILDKQYDNELEEFTENGYPIGIPHFDMGELEENKEKQRIDTPPPSIDISGEANSKPNNNSHIDDVESVSIDITKMLEKNVPNDMKSIDFSYELTDIPFNDNSQNFSIPLDINISDIHEEKQPGKTEQSSINISNNDDMSNKITNSDMKKIDLKPTKLYDEFIDKIEHKQISNVKEASEDINNKKVVEKKSSIVNNIIDSFKSKQQTAGSKILNKDKLLFDQNLLNDVSALSISQNAMNSQSIENSNELSKNKLENFSVDISNDFNGGLKSIDIGKEASLGLQSLDISNDFNGGLKSIDIRKEASLGLQSIDISNDFNGGAQLFNTNSGSKKNMDNNLSMPDLSNFNLKYD